HILPAPPIFCFLQRYFALHYLHSFPTKVEEELVVGATINLNGLIEVKVTKREEDSVLASIIKAVEDAQGTKAPIQRMADKIANYFVPIVVGIAVLTFIVWITLVSPGE